MDTRTHNRTQRHTSSSASLSWFTLPVVFAAAIILFAWFLWIGDRSITAENALLENLQLLFLSAGFGFHLKQRSISMIRASRICHSAFALLCFSIMLREVDIDKIGTTAIWSHVEILLRIATAIAWLLLAYIVALNIRALWTLRREIASSFPSVATAIAIGLYMFSWPFDKGYMPMTPDISQFIEESLQLTATIYLMTASLRPIRLPLRKGA